MDRPYFEQRIGEKYESGGIFGKKTLFQVIAIIAVVVVKTVKAAELQGV